MCDEVLAPARTYNSEESANVVEKKHSKKGMRGERQRMCDVPRPGLPAYVHLRDTCDHQVEIDKTRDRHGAG